MNSNRWHNVYIKSHIVNGDDDEFDQSSTHMVMKTMNRFLYSLTNFVISFSISNSIEIQRFYKSITV